MRLFNDKKYYLLGKRKEDNRKVWLEEGSWDCDWYWGLGYVEIFSYKYKDIDEERLLCVTMGLQAICNKILAYQPTQEEISYSIKSKSIFEVTFGNEKNIKA